MNADAPEFSITRTLDAPQEHVWQAWTDPAEFAEWMRPFGVRAETVAIDVRVGGRYRYEMVNEDTHERFPTGGQYLEVEPMDRLVFTWGEPDAQADAAPVITLTLIPHGQHTELVFHMRGHDAKPGDGFIYDGWDQALANLGHHFSGATRN
jgi:uncharacterized protein YndB with AHSA1/START domain